MGADAVTIEVFADDDAVLVRQRLLRAVVDDMANDPDFKRVETPEEADRVIYLGPAERWVAVYDTFRDQYDMARWLSDILDRTVVAANLIDSDVVNFKMFHGARLIDEYCNEIGIYDNEPEERREVLKGDVAAWQPLFADPDTDPGVLRELWDSRPIIADDIFYATMRLLGMKTERYQTDPNDDLFDPLYYRYTGARYFEAEAEGPTVFSLGSYSLVSELSVGETLPLITTLDNTGGASQGLTAVVWGSAIEDGLIRLLSVKTRSGAGLPTRHQIDDLSFEVDGRKHAAHGAYIADYSIEAGISQVPPTEKELHLFQMKAFTSGLNRSVWVLISLRGERAGRGELYVAFIPHTNPEGQAAYGAKVTVTPAPRRPAHFHLSPPPQAEDDEADPRIYYLKEMVDDRYLFLATAFRVPVADLIQDLAATILEWRDVLMPMATIEGIHRSNLYVLSDKVPLAVKQEVARYLQTGAQLDGRIGEAMPETDKMKPPMPHWPAGFTFFAQTIPAGDEAAPHLILWCDTHVTSAESVPDAQAMLRRAADGWLSRGFVAQAAMGRWNVIPSSYAYSYEGATGIHGQVTETKGWVGRYLRIVSENLWLGPQLIDVLGGDLSELKRVANTVEMGAGIRLELHADKTLNELEEALMPLLPTPEVWHESMQEHYRTRFSDFNTDTSI